jgi:DNA-binding transcriptional LysR family regulator
MPHDLQLDWLRCFVAVIDTGSLSAAAPELHRSQSAVSMQLKKLEQALGHRVIDRGAGRLALTAQGHALLGYARRILDLHAEAQSAIAGDAALSGRVRLGVPDDYAAKYLTPVLKRFAPRHAGVEIELTCEQSTSLIPLVARGEIDLAWSLARTRATARCCSTSRWSGWAPRNSSSGATTRCRSRSTRRPASPAATP